MLKGPPTPFACPQRTDLILLPHGCPSEGTNLWARARRTCLQAVTIPSTPAIPACRGQSPEIF